MLLPGRLWVGESSLLCLPPGHSHIGHSRSQTVQGTRPKARSSERGSLCPKKKKCKKAKWLSEEILQITEKRRDAKGKGEKERVPKNSKQR